MLRLGNVVHEDIQDSLTRVRTLNSTNNNSKYIDSTNTEKENKNKEKELEFDVEGEVKIEELNVRGFYDIVAKQKESDI